MTNNRHPIKPYDLEERGFQFAKQCRNFVEKLPKNTANIEYGKQLIRSSGSQAANYIEANEAHSKKDFKYRIRISRKETKESCLWLRLCTIIDNKFEPERINLINEANELRNIYSAINNKIIFLFKLL